MITPTSKHVCLETHNLNQDLMNNAPQDTDGPASPVLLGKKKHFSVSKEAFTMYIKILQITCAVCLQNFLVQFVGCLEYLSICRPAVSNFQQGV